MSANNDEVLSRIDALARQIEAERERNDERYVLRADFEARMDRLTMEVVREVSATLQAMALDAMRTAMQAEFGDLMKKERERERAERKEDIANVFKWTKASAQYVLPLLQVIILAVTVWGLFVR